MSRHPVIRSRRAAGTVLAPRLQLATRTRQGLPVVDWFVRAAVRAPELRGLSSLGVVQDHRSFEGREHPHGPGGHGALPRGRSPADQHVVRPNGRAAPFREAGDFVSMRNGPFQESLATALSVVRRKACAAGDRQSPRQKPAAIHAKARPGKPGARQGLLDHVLRIEPARDRPTSGGLEESATVSPDQHVPRGCVSAPSSTGEGSVVERFELAALETEGASPPFPVHEPSRVTGFSVSPLRRREANLPGHRAEHGICNRGR